MLLSKNEFCETIQLSRQFTANNSEKLDIYVSCLKNMI